MGHLQQMVHDTHGFYCSKIINKIRHLGVLLLRLPLKTHIWSHCLMKRMEQCYLRPQKRVLKKIRVNQVLCQLTVKPKANVSSQLNFRPFVSCQLTPFRPSCWMPFLWRHRLPPEACPLIFISYRSSSCESQLDYKRSIPLSKEDLWLNSVLT